MAQLRWRDFELARGGRLLLRGGTITDEPMFFEGDSVGIIAAAWDGGDLDALVFGGLSISQLNRRGRAAQARTGKLCSQLLFYEGRWRRLQRHSGLSRFSPLPVARRVSGNTGIPV